ncbi:Uncharacterised protein g10432 [Pycnogonum litorale]
MDASEALKSFDELVQKVTKGGSLQLGLFFKSISDRYLTATCSGERIALAHHSLRMIADSLRHMVPFSGILHSEEAKVMHTDQKKKKKNFVDSFLYDTDEIDELIREKKIPENCLDAVTDQDDDNSVEYNSVSVSKNLAAFIFQSLITKYLKDSTVVDIGSRLGSVLYGAYFFSAANNIIGIEENEELCEIQKKIVHQYELSDRIKIVQGSVEDNDDSISHADVINVSASFSYLMDVDGQRNLWKFLRRSIKKPGTLIVAPNVPDIFAKLEIEDDASVWLKEVFIEDPLCAMYLADHPDIAATHLYEVL